MTSLLLVTLCITLSSAISYADIDGTIYVPQSLRVNTERVDYIAHLSDCSDLVSIQVSSEGLPQVLAKSDSRPVSGSQLACEFPFSASGDNRFNPSFTLSFTDGTQQVINKAFALDTEAPDVTVDSIFISDVDGQQVIFVNVMVMR